MRTALLVSVALYGLGSARLTNWKPKGHNWEPKGHEWSPATPWDSRSPCPGLNALANHGWLPRSGKDISLEDIQYSISTAFNFVPDALDSVFQLVQDFQLSTTGNVSTFNLEDLKAHDTIEIDGSLSRNDFYFGDDLHFDPKVWIPVAENLGLYKTGHALEDKLVTIEVAAKARAARVKEAMRVNPQFNATARQQSGSIGTTALYLTTLWDDEVNATYKSWVRPFFEEERIPYLEGYTNGTKQKTPEDIGNIIAAVSSVPV